MPRLVPMRYERQALKNCTAARVALPPCDVLFSLRRLLSRKGGCFEGRPSSLPTGHG